ncbi:CoA synthetase [Nocardioides caldifontis]|uniref:CoA synthetase n=1 Tax=Nocardioides caldifontis TaxID=2588938 RepID=UPI0011E045AC|nr:CoA synthetase [Nocardioides caldifontis]
MTTPEASVKERIAILLSRELEDDWVACTGVGSTIPLAACMLAQAAHAPSLTVLAGGIFVDPRRLVPEFCAGYDAQPEHIADMSDLFAITELGIDVIFYSGMQIDHHANINLHRVKMSSGSVLRGPGIANTSFGHTARRVFLWTERHDARTLRENVDFVSVAGHRYKGLTRQELGLPNQGPTILVTSEVLFRPDHEGLLQPVGIHGSADWSSVSAATGWELGPADVPTLDPIEDAELTLLRKVVDPMGMLRR